MAGYITSNRHTHQVFSTEYNRIQFEYSLQDLLDWKEECELILFELNRYIICMIMLASEYQRTITVLQSCEVYGYCGVSRALTLLLSRKWNSDVCAAVVWCGGPRHFSARPKRVAGELRLTQRIPERFNCLRHWLINTFHYFDGRECSKYKYIWHMEWNTGTNSSSSTVEYSCYKSELSLNGRTQSVSREIVKIKCIIWQDGFCHTRRIV